MAARDHRRNWSTTWSTEVRSASPRAVCTRPGDGTVELQRRQMRPHGGVDDVGDGVVPARDVEQRRDVDARGVRFSHARLGRRWSPFGSVEISVVR